MKTAVCILLVTLSQSWAQDPNYFSRAICGQARFCVSQPSDCDPQLADSCDAFASWKLSGDGTKLELALYATTATYVAFGFSNSGSMARSDVYACTTNNDVIRSWNRDGYGNEERTLKGVSGETVSSTNGVISCQFSRDLSLNDGDQEFFDLTSSQSVYALMAWNGPLRSSTRLGQHPFQVGRFFWPQPIDFTQTLPAVTTMPTNPMTAIISESPFTGTEEQPMTSIISGSPITGTEAQTLFSRSVCGQSRFCASKPEGCDPQMGSCDAFSSWKLSDDGTKVEFALYAKTMTYIAMGLTETPSMDNSDVYACATGNNNILRSRNVGYSNSDLVLRGVSDATIAFADGVITCKFTRVLSLGSEDSEFFDLTSGNFHIIMSWGGSLSGSSLRKHLSSFVGDSFDFTQSMPEVPTTTTTREMVQANTRIGPGYWSLGAITKTKEGLPSPPQNIKVSNKSKFSLTVEWDVPEIPAGDIIRYEICDQALEKPYNPDFKVIPCGPHTMIVSPHTHIVHRITSLEPSTVYRIEVSAYTSAGQGKISNITARTEIADGMREMHLCFKC